jgi:quercetin dioxygenase-like cupin family protein
VLDFDRILRQPFAEKRDGRQQMAIIAVRSDEAAETDGGDNVRTEIYFGLDTLSNVVRMTCEPGWRSLRHHHTHDEITYVLEGELICSDGKRYYPGDVLLMEAGTIYNHQAGPAGLKTIAFIRNTQDTTFYENPPDLDFRVSPMIYELWDANDKPT